MNDSIQFLLDEYLQYQLSMEKFVKASADAVRSDCRGLLRYMDQKGIKPTIAAFSTRIVADYLATNRRRVSGATLKRWYKSLNGFGRWAEDHDYIQRNPLTKVDLGWVPSHRREFMFAGAEEAQRFMNAAAQTGLIPEVDWLLRALLLFAGLRRNEVLKLSWSCVDWENRELRIYDSKATRKKGLPDLLDRVVPICPALFDALAAAYRVTGQKPGGPVVWKKPGRRLPKDAFYAAFHAIAKAAGMPDDAVPHFLRHNLASSLTGLGATAADVALLLGHRNGNSDRPTTTDGYITSSLVRARSFVDAYCRLVMDGVPVPGDLSAALPHPAMVRVVTGPTLPQSPAVAENPRSCLDTPSVPWMGGEEPGASNYQQARRVAEAAELWMSLVPGGSLNDPEFRRFLRAVIRTS